MGTRRRVIGLSSVVAAFVIVLLSLSSSVLAVDLSGSGLVSDFARVPSEHPAYDLLAELGRYGLIEYPVRVKYGGELARIEMAGLIAEASERLDSTTDDSLLSSAPESEQERLRLALAGLREEFSDQIRILGQLLNRSWNTPVGGDRQSRPIPLSDFLSRAPVDEPVSDRVSGQAYLDVPKDVYESDVIKVKVPLVRDLTFDVAGSISKLREDSPSGGCGGPIGSFIHRDYINGLSYSVNAKAESSGLVLTLSHEGTYQVPKNSLTLDKSYSEARATYEITRGLELAAVLGARRDTAAASSTGGVDISLQVVPNYLSASLGLNIASKRESTGDVSGSQTQEFGIGLQGEYPVSDSATIRGDYWYQLYNKLSSSDGNRGSKTRFSTGLDYTISPQASLSADLEYVGDPSKGAVSTTDVGIGYSISEDSSLQLKYTRTDVLGSPDADADPGSKFSAEVKMKF